MGGWAGGRRLLAIHHQPVKRHHRPRIILPSNKTSMPIFSDPWHKDSIKQSTIPSDKILKLQDVLVRSFHVKQDQRQAFPAGNLPDRPVNLSELRSLDFFRVQRPTSCIFNSWS